MWTCLAWGSDARPGTYYRLRLKGARELTCRSIDSTPRTIRCEIDADQFVALPRSSVLTIDPLEKPPEEPRSSFRSVLGPENPKDAWTDTDLEHLSPGARKRVQRRFAEFRRAVTEHHPAVEIGDLALAIAREYLMAHDWYHAERWIDTAEKHAGKTAKSLYDRAWMAFVQRRFGDADTWARQALQKDPRAFPILRLLGNIAQAEDRLEDAAGYWEQALAIQPDEDLARRLARLQVEIARMRHYHEQATRWFNLRYSDQLPPRLENNLIRLLTDLYFEVRRLTRWDAREPIPVRVYTQTDYRTILRTPDWSGAAYDGIIHLPVRGLSGSPAELRRSIRHELCHALITQHTADQAPAWFQEGVAQTCEYHGETMTLEREWRRLVRRFGIPPGEILRSGTFSRFSESSALLLYRTSYAWVQYLYQRYGQSGVHRFVNAMAEGRPWPEAFELAFGRPFHVLYESWRYRRLPRAPGAFR